MIEGFQWGGQLMITSDVENYPGYPDGVMGPEMMADFRRQAERFGTEFITDDVTKVDFSERPFRVWVGDDEYRARAVIVATGASARWLGIESEQQHPGPRRLGVRDLRRRVLPREGGVRRRRRRLGVRGGAVPDEASRRRCTLVHRRDEFRASQIMVDRAQANEKIDFVLNAESSTRSSARPKVEALRLRNTDDRTRRWEVEAGGLFVAIGHDPNTALFVDQLDHDDGRLPDHEARHDRDEHRRACSRPATCRTTPTGRRSPPPARAAWRRSTPSASWPRWRAIPARR